MPPKKKPPRAYSSANREQHAEQTRQRMIDAARKLFLALGFDRTTIDAVAIEAGVSKPTVYAAFKSKRGLVAEILNRARFGPGYGQLVKQAMTESDPEARVRMAARISRQVYDSERSEMELLRGAGVVSPDLSDEQREQNRYVLQKKLIDFLSEAGRLRKDLDHTTARDLLYVLTARDLYRQFVVVRGWDPVKYEQWLADTLVLLLMRSR